MAQTYLDEFSSTNSLTNQIKLLKQLPWKHGEYVKQSWPNWLHHLSPYAGRMTPQIAHWLIRIFSKTDDVILDPFCGIGTIPLEANMLGRNSIGFDLNPYAYLIASAKMERRKIDRHIKYLSNLEIVPNKNLLKSVPEWVHVYYNKKTLIELLTIIEFLKKRNETFLLGCLIGVAQGHRIGHISKPSALTLPYRPNPDDPGIYKEVMPRLINKIKRMYKDGFEDIPSGTIKKADARKMTLKDNSVDCVISSPPYLDNLDYVNANRLRLALMGVFEEKAKKLSLKLKYRKEPYLKMMNDVCAEISRVLKPKHYCVLVIGDVHNKKDTIITTELLHSTFLENNLQVIDEVADAIPFNRSVQRTVRMKNSTLNPRMDRIIILRNNK